MRTVVYLSNQQIQVVVGTPGQKKIGVSNIYTGDAPDGSIINGIVMDTDLFVGFMKEFWAKNNLPTKDVVCVINSSKFTGKTIELPPMNDQKTLEFIEREFADVSRGEELVYGMIPIGVTDKMRKMYVESISADFIKDYVDIFQEIGIKVKEIHSGQGSLISLTQMTITKHHQTFILEIADRMTLTTLLWVNGSFYYFNSIRCFHEQGTEDYAMDIAKSVSQVTQFMQAHQIEFPLETVALAGVDPMNLFMYQNAILQQGMQLPVILYEADTIQGSSLEMQYHLPAISGLVVSGNGKWQNYLTRFKTKSDKKENGQSLKGLIGIVACLVVMLVLLGASIVFKNIKEKELQELKEYNTSPEIMMQVVRFDYLTERVNFLVGQHASLIDVKDNIYTYPVGNNVVTKKIKDCAGNYAEVSFESFDANAGVVSMTAKAASVDDINKFIKKLNDETIFSKVDYTGYSYVTAEDKWDIHVTITLAESAGR